jgi:CBS domain-containing protein
MRAKELSIMSTVREILARKGSHVMTVGTAATVLEAACLMNEHQIGALVVINQGTVVGMFTERDILRRVVGERRNPETTTVGEIMTTEVVCCSPETTIEEARVAMKERRVRHLPLVDGDYRLRGLISIGDLNAYEAYSQEQTIYLLREYLHGRV